MDTANTLSYLLPTITFGSSTGQDRSHLRTEIKSPRDVDAATSEYGEFAAHFSKLRAIPIDRSLWVEGIEPPSEQAVIWARAALQQLQASKFLPTRIVASAEGGIAICFVEGDKYSDIECLNSGAILGVISNKRNRPIVWEIEQNARSIARATARIREFLNPSKTWQDVSERPERRLSFSPA